MGATTITPANLAQRGLVGGINSTNVPSRIKGAKPMSKVMSRHAPGFIREIFQDAVEALAEWHARQNDGPEPTVEFEGDPVTIATACKLVARCTDQMPRATVETLTDHDVLTRRTSTATYAAGAQAVRRWLRWIESRRFKVATSADLLPAIQQSIAMFKEDATPSS
jgi:hypothetical protein